MALRLAPQDADIDEEVDTEVLTERAARQLTNLIRSGVAKVADLLLQSLEGRAYHALGYANWETYIDGEFEFTSRHAYRLVSQAKAMRALAAAPVPPDTRVRIPQVSSRLAAAIGGDYEGVAAAWAERVGTGEKTEDALAQAVVARKAERKVIPVDSRETNGHAAAPKSAMSDEAIMAAGAELREQLLAWVDGIRTAVRYAPKANQPPETPAEMLDELHVWVGTISSVVNIENLKPLRRLIGETYVLAKAIGGQGERKVLADLAGCTIGNIDFRVNAIRTGDFSD